MFKKIGFCLCLVLLLSAVPAFAADDDTVTVMWNDEKVVFPDQQPIIENDYVLVPVRPVVEKKADYIINVITDQPALHFTIQHDDNPNGYISALFNLGSPNDYVYSDGKTVFKDGKTIPGKSMMRPLPTPMKIVNGRTLVPVRTIGELFGEVTWDAATRTVQITESK